MRSWRQPAYGALAMLAMGDACAQWSERPLDAVLTIERYHMDWSYDSGEVHRSRLTTAGLALLETVGGQWRGGVKLAHVRANQSGDTAVAAHAPTGALVALSLEFRTEEPWLLQPLARTQYTYADLDGAEGDREVTLQWHALELQLGTALKLTGPVSSALYGYFLTLDGDQHTRPGSTAGFENEAEAGAALRLDWQVDATGHVGLDLMTGAKQGAAIYFSRQF